MSINSANETLEIRLIQIIKIIKKTYTNIKLLYSLKFTEILGKSILKNSVLGTWSWETV